MREHENEKALWLEGIFAPQSPSLAAVTKESERQGRVIQHIVAYSDADTLIRRIGRRDSGRMRLAKKYARWFDYRLGAE